MASAAAPLNLRNQIPISPTTASSSSSFSPICALNLKTPKFITITKPPKNPNLSTFRISLPTTLCRSASALPNPGQDPKPETDLSNPTLEQDTIKEAIEAVREYLQQVGASSVDASHISTNCPNYVNMLIDGVNDLDDWNSWAEKAGKPVEFKRKVYQMAEQKGDKGVLPFLESHGISLSSATYLARYLSSSSATNALPLLIQKVKYVKDIFFSGSESSGNIGRNARRMMWNLSISTDEDLQQTLAFLEKIQARRGGLSQLDTERASFPYLIESFPHLLLKPQESRVKPILKLLEDIGVPKGSIRNILLLYPPILSYDIDKDIKPRLRLYKKVGLHDNDLAKMLVKYPWILSASILENFDKIVHFFDEEKVPRICAIQAIKNWPHILGCSVDKIKLMVEQFGEIGISNKKLGQIIAKSPQLLLHKPQEFIQMVTFFKSLGLDEEAIARTLGRCPEIFAASIDNTLKKKLDFLSSVGISKSNLPRVIRKYPDLFVCDVDRTLLPRVRYLMKIGLSKKAIGSMISRFSPLLGYSVEEVLRPKIEFLVNTMVKPVSEVVEYPRYLSYSLEKKIKPRYWVLRSRNIDINLKEMLGKNDEEFAADYLGVGELPVSPS